jgi:hypothetical protein
MATVIKPEYNKDMLRATRTATPVAIRECGLGTRLRRGIGWKG